MKKEPITFKEHQKKQLKKGIMVLRDPSATRKEELERRKDMREGGAISRPAVTRGVMEGKTVALKTGKYVPAGRFKNLKPHNR